MQWEEVGLFLTAPVTGRRAGSGPRCCREQSMSRGGCWDLCHWPVTPSPSVEPRGGRGGMEASPHGAALPELRLDPRRVTRLEPPLPLPGEPQALNRAAACMAHRGVQCPAQEGVHRVLVTVLLGTEIAHASPRLGPGDTGERGAFRFPRRRPPSHAARAAFPLRPGHRRRAGSGLPFPTCPLLSPRAAVVPGGTVSGTFGEPVV